MARLWRGRLIRAVAASPFLLLSLLCLSLMDAEKMGKQWQPMLDAGRIEWDGGSVPILSAFYHNKILDDFWRGLTVLFSPSTLGYDPVAWWVGFVFVIHLAPLYAIWMLESHRAVSTSGPARLPTIFTSLGQALGSGVVAPVFYFLCLVFGRPSSDLARLKSEGKSARSWEIRPVPFMLPLVLLLHMVGVSAAFLAPRFETRHFWTWTWLLSPMALGFGDAVLARLFYAPAPCSLERRGREGQGRQKRSAFGSPELQLGALAVLSAGTWIYMLARAPFSLSDIFVPETIAAQDDFILHSRVIMQLDCLVTFGASLLWLLYVCFDLARAGVLTEADGLSLFGLLPVVLAAGGPGTACAVLWGWKERAAQRWVAGCEEEGHDD
ncbi:hypothetical protein CDD83_7803 [Cordyceps sp. RAO-2017]|nr:hypothetical protein CDD83_7803 [Cordyceps sp. RAO-2017]